MENDPLNLNHSNEHRSRMYSPGGCSCGLLMLPVVAVSVGIFIAMVGYALVSVVMLIVAIALTVHYVRTKEQRALTGKDLGPRPFFALLYVLSVPYLIFFAWFFLTSA